MSGVTGHCFSPESGNLGQWRIVCVTRSRGAVEIFRPWLIEWCITAYAFGKVRIGDVVSTEGNEVTGSFGDKAGTMLGVDTDVQDERSTVKPTEIVDHGVSAHKLNWSAGKVCHLPHEACAMAWPPFSIDIFARRSVVGSAEGASSFIIGPALTPTRLLDQLQAPPQGFKGCARDSLPVAVVVVRRLVTS
jgi:hypothetical protein